MMTSPGGDNHNDDNGDTNTSETDKPGSSDHENELAWSAENIQSTLELWQLSDSEQDNLKILQQRLQDISHWKNCPSEVVRFLRARQGCVTAAETMFRKMVEWRRINNVETVLEDYHPPQLLVDYYPGAILEGLDKAGDPIFVGRLGVTDAAGMVRRFGREEMIRHAIWHRELVSKGDWIQQYHERQGRPVKRITIIEDLNGLSGALMNRELLSLYGEVMALDQDNYCETAKKLIVIRTPFIFRMVWSLVKHFFDPGVVEKMVFVGSKDYQSVLDQYMDRDVLPPCICPEGRGMAAPGMPSRFEGGKLPPSAEEMEQ